MLGIGHAPEAGGSGVCIIPQHEKGCIVIRATMSVLYQTLDIPTSITKNPWLSAVFSGSRITS
jgi:hypothetical protein